MSLFKELDVPLDDVRGMGMVVSKLLPDSMTATKIASTTCIASFFQGIGSSLQLKLPSNSKAPDDVDEKMPLVFAPKSDQCTCIPDLEEEDQMLEDANYHDTGVEHLVAAPQPSQGNIALPPLSQICMSQVAALPQEMQNEIRSRMSFHDQQDDRCRHASAIEPVLVDLTRDPGDIILDHQGEFTAAKGIKSFHAFAQTEKQSYRQINLKRLMKLAAVKSGDEPSAVAGMSLVDFQALPLEIQLQIANCDTGPLGLLSQKQPKLASKKQGLAIQPRQSASKKPEHLRNEKHYEAAVASWTSDKEEAVEIIRRTVDLFDDDIVPLHRFLDDNSPTNPDAMNSVHAYFRACLVERRMNLLRPLLQSIRNRKDAVWSKEEVLTEIGQVLDETHFELYRRRLDVSWMVD
jgi:hypothetical protein